MSKTNKVNYGLEVKEMGRWKLLAVGEEKPLLKLRRQLKGKTPWDMELIRVIRIFNTLTAALADSERKPVWDHHTHLRNSKTSP